MTEAIAITVFIDGPTAAETAACVASLTSVAEVLASLDALPDRLAEFAAELVSDGFGDRVLDATFEGGKLIVIETKTVPADGTNRVVVLVNPGDGLHRLVAAITDELDGRVEVDFRHGWPVLSVADRTSTVAEGGGGATAPSGGLA